MLTSPAKLRYEIHYECFKGKRGIVKAPADSPITMKVRANKRFMAIASPSFFPQDDAMYFSFVPKKGRTYTVTYSGERGKDGNMTVTSDNGEPAGVTRTAGNWPKCKGSIY